MTIVSTLEQVMLHELAAVYLDSPAMAHLKNTHIALKAISCEKMFVHTDER